MTECTPIPKAGPKRKRRRSIRARAPKVVAAVERRSGGRCEVWGLGDTPGRCWLRAEHFHHRLRQSQGGPDTADNLLHVCGYCHHDAHHLGQRSYDLGLLIRSGQPITPYVPEVA